ncbi:MAG: NapC/NirT family cytochrome c [Dehalobacterium sp.]
MKRTKRIALISFITLLGLYAAFMLVYFPTSEPSFCSRCHLVKPYVQSWEKKSHHDVKCLFCHENRGYFGKIDSKARGLNYVYLTFTNQEVPIIAEAKIFEQNCIKCHLDGNKKYPQAPKIDQKQINDLKQDKSCLECHRDTGHDVNIFSLLE